MGLIPVNLVTGFLGVGKTTAVRHLLAQHPADERWAVLVNEFGDVGIDGALLADAGVVVQEVAGGCLCCVAAPAFTTGLNRIIRQHRPDRILIEPSGLGHPAQVLDTLTGPLYENVLDMRATICLMDARHLGSPRHVAHPNFQDQIHLADVLVANKADSYTERDVEAFESFVAGLTPAKLKIGITQLGRIDPAWLDLKRASDRRAAFPEAHAFLLADSDNAHQHTADDNDWIIIEGEADGYHRAGWLIREHHIWPESPLRHLLDTLDVERTKGLFHTDQGWRSYNQGEWRETHPPSDRQSRLELIDPQAISITSIDTRISKLLLSC